MVLYFTREYSSFIYFTFIITIITFFIRIFCSLYECCLNDTGVSDDITEYVSDNTGTKFDQEDYTNTQL